MKAEIGTYPKDRQILHEIVPLDTPLVVDIHMHHYCNFLCNYCAMSVNPEQLEKTAYKLGSMNMELFTLIVQQLHDFPRKIKMITMEGFGEPTIHPNIVDMVRLLHDSGVTDKIQMITNGSMLNPQFNEALINAGLGELRISLQGLNEKKYLQISNAKINWDEFYENICHFSRIRKTCTLKVKIVDTVLEIGDDEKFYALFGNICDAVSIEHIYNPWTQNGVNIDIKTIGGGGG
jgi:molybdenum cofactor biosynthesis enzyme MoaA